MSDLSQHERQFGKSVYLLDSLPLRQHAPLLPSGRAVGDEATLGQAEGQSQREEDGGRTLNHAEPNR